VNRRLLLCCSSLLLVVLLPGCDSRSPERGTPPPDTNAAPAARPVANPYEKLAGRWQRPDGGYVLELGAVDEQGRFTAAYFNPSPINVEQARGALESDGVKVFVVLRDVNYPGCVYRLAYDAKADQLFGTYYQAGTGATYDVNFARVASGTP